MLITQPSPPYSAKPSGGQNDWWYVADSRGLNVVQLPEKPGAKFTSKERAESIARQMNEQQGKA
jgi:hypothetical protein